MKKRLLVLLALLLSCTTLVSMAAAPIVRDHFGTDGFKRIPRNQPEEIFTIESPGGLFNWELLRENNAGTAWQAVVNRGDYDYPTAQQNVSGPVNVYWDYMLDGDFIAGDGGHNHMLRAENVDGKGVTEVPFFVIWMSNLSYDLVSFRDYIDDGSEPVVRPQIKYTWYPNNTASSFGPQFREVKPSITDKWYMFTPIDLGRDGVQSFELVGGDKYVIGKVDVSVSGDSVKVEYKNRYGTAGHTKTLDEFFTIFKDLDSVGSVDPADFPDNPFKFGEAFSISEMLEGDTNVLLFVRNVVTFRDYVDNKTPLLRYWKNLPERRALRDQMLQLMDSAE